MDGGTGRLIGIIKLTVDCIVYLAIIVKQLSFRYCIVPQAVPADRVDVTLVIDIQSGTWTISMECELAVS